MTCPACQGLRVQLIAALTKADRETDTLARVAADLHASEQQLAHLRAMRVAERAELDRTRGERDELRRVVGVRS